MTTTMRTSRNKITCHKGMLAMEENISQTFSKLIKKQFKSWRFTEITSHFLFTIHFSFITYFFAKLIICHRCKL